MNATTSQKWIFSSISKSEFNQIVTLKNEVESMNNSETKNNIEYKKYNPFVFGKNSGKKFNTWYNFLKFSIIIATFIFALLALWYTTQWKDNAMTNLGIDIHKYQNVFEGSVWNVDWTTKYDGAKTLALYEWATSNNINKTTLDVLVAFSFVGIVLLIPSMVFKNGTIFSLVSLALTFSSLVVVIVLFSMCIDAQSEVVSTFNNNDIAKLKFDLEIKEKKLTEINNILDHGKPSAEEKAKLELEKAELTKAIEELKNKINSEVTRVVEKVLSLVLVK